jgi:hypothetical protein
MKCCVDVHAWDDIPEITRRRPFNPAYSVDFRHSNEHNDGFQTNPADLLQFAVVMDLF